MAGAGLAEPHLRPTCSPFTLNRILSHTKQTAACQLTQPLSLEDSPARGASPLRRPLAEDLASFRQLDATPAPHEAGPLLAPPHGPTPLPLLSTAGGPSPLTATGCPGRCCEGAGGGWHGGGLQGSRDNQTATSAQVSGQGCLCSLHQPTTGGRACLQTPCPRV